MRIEETEGYPALQVAREVCDKANWKVSNLHLNKLLYVAFCYHLGKNEEELISDDSFQSWDYGPVLPKVYHQAKIFGREPVLDIFPRYEKELSDQVKHTIEAIVNSLRDWTPANLVSLTHQEDGAWAKHYSPGQQGAIIDSKDILGDYGRFFKNNGSQ